MLRKLYGRILVLTSPAERDRGEGPVPYIILVALIGILAVAVYTALNGIVTGWLGHVPKNP
ncbi:MAG: hypothetical protein HOV71_20035 [Hamadaea sp.]|uniref:hypothetical protein n=1 Tax=Hamadaea sp. NPDC050747 TaxID=3155789 RepID=UPI00183E5DFE|nr:hypothetical protein [Hamadaea sp.]NUR50422.1 hypothetical protein [Hamadaea sp.]NUT08596.1 hypothetical protein [Hamadaea sp.]